MPNKKTQNLGEILGDGSGAAQANGPGPDHPNLHKNGPFLSAVADHFWVRFWTFLAKFLDGFGPIFEQF